jgi:hypothetical protein
MGEKLNEMNLYKRKQTFYKGIDENNEGEETKKNII